MTLFTSEEATRFGLTVDRAEALGKFIDGLSARQGLQDDIRQEAWVECLQCLLEDPSLDDKTLRTIAWRRVRRFLGRSAWDGPRVGDSTDYARVVSVDPVVLELTVETAGGDLSG